MKAKNARGINELINTGEILNTVLKDCFTDINIYDEECKLIRLRFKSPIANSAIGFYRFYLQDTLCIEGDSVIDVGFIPNNQQDVGFSGHVYVMKDSSYQVRRVELTIPKRSDVNWVESMSINQDYEDVATVPVWLSATTCSSNCASTRGSENCRCNTPPASLTMPSTKSPTVRSST